MDTKYSGQRQAKNASDITYVTGWCYQNQLNGLRTGAPHVLPDPNSLPPGVDPAAVREQELTRGGFVPSPGRHATAYLYRARQGPRWTRDGIRTIANDDVAPHWLNGRTEGARPQASMPRKYPRLSASKGDAVSNLRTLFHNQDTAIGVTVCTDPMPYFLRNADGDDLFFVHDGEGVIETEFGPLGLERGYYVWIPRGTLYRIVPDSPQLYMFHIENYGERFQKPDTGITGDAALYYHRNIQVPTACYDLSDGAYTVLVKQAGAFTAYEFDHHPCDVIGWDGDLAPFRFNAEDFKPITSWRAHIPPSAYCTFLGDGFEVCTFAPRPVETGERSLPVPFDHINHDRDEVIFFHEGLFFSKDKSEAGAMTFHARGFSHGPHENALQRALDRRDAEGGYMLDGYAVMIETNLPLTVSPWAESVEEMDYPNSWRR
ncbi:MAG: homogentisate 1,2-dioxygenase [Alphaproteobacteria bacterium]|jgi:homogentisate 1,2-dioxygenase